MAAAWLLIGCSPAPPVQPGNNDFSVLPTWPPAPQSARIQLVEIFYTPDDLGIRPSVFRRLVGTIAGAEKTGMIRPYAISVHGERIVVGDPGAKAVHIYDRGRGRYQSIGKLDDESLRSPVGVALSEDRIFISDSALGKIFILDLQGPLIHAIEGLQRPTGLAFDEEANRLYVADTLRHCISVFDDDGTALFEFGARGTGEGEFNFPSHVHLSGGRLLINDNMNFRIQSFDLEGHFQSSFGTHGDGSGHFSQPKGVASDSLGHIYVAGATIDRIQVFSQAGEFLLAFGSEGSGPGQFLMPAGLAAQDDMIYVADSYNSRVQVFRYVGGD